MNDVKIVTTVLKASSILPKIAQNHKNWSEIISWTKNDKKFKLYPWYQLFISNKW